MPINASRGAPFVLGRPQIAYHLAAHVVAAVHCGAAPHEVHLPPRGEPLAEQSEMPTNEGLGAEAHIERATSSIAGPVAECLTLGLSGSTSRLMHISRQLVMREDEAGVTEDLHDAWTELAQIFQLDLVADSQLPEREAAWNWLIARALRLVELWWEEISGIATELLIHGALDEARLCSLLCR